jgi:hypothetical protein
VAESVKILCSREGFEWGFPSSYPKKRIATKNENLKSVLHCVTNIGKEVYHLHNQKNSY